MKNVAFLPPLPNSAEQPSSYGNSTIAIDGNIDTLDTIFILVLDKSSCTGIAGGYSFRKVG